MVILSRSTLSSIALIYALGFGRLSLSSLDAGEHAVTQSWGGLQGVGDLSSSSTIVIDDPKEITQEERLLELDSAARKAEIKLLDDTCRQIERRIRRLAPSKQVRTQLEDLRLALKRPILDRVLQLSGLGPSMTSLNAVRHPGQAGSSIRRTTLQLSESSSWTNKLWSWLKSLSHSIVAHQNREMTYIEIPDDVLLILKELMSNDMMKSWTSLENTLIEFEAHADPQFFGNPLYLGGLHSSVSTTTARFHSNMEIFKTPTLFKMVKYHVELLFSKERTIFFDRPESVIPQLYFLTTSQNFKHFHRTIKGLPVKDQRHVVYIVLSAIMDQAPWHTRFDEDHGMSRSFYNIRGIITESTFLDKADRLSSALINEPQIDHIGTFENIWIVYVIKTVIKDLQTPAKTYKASRRVEFLVVYYLSHFLNTYYGALFEAVLRRSEDRSFFHERMDYLTAYLTFFRHRFEDPRLKQDGSFPASVSDGNTLYNVAILQWMETVTTYTFDHSLILHHELDRSPHFTLWMGTKCCYCASPFRTCPPSCPAAKLKQII
ncbi:hypothetical protein PSHT_06132 [Puccinia striiformis]|uniref:Uncharacterized protein n=1 Tax=Puccinia striiformis TaxID=27350 RepID=A0A2S4W8Y4_9BASI|nr:hypothetical protein PSHT_06132 [Puccinia striiformis]